MVKVVFNSVPEFLEELALSKPSGKVVRLACKYQGSKLSPNISLVSVLANFICNGQLISLEAYAGDSWGLNNDHDKAVQERVARWHNDIEGKCRELGLEVRSGAFVEA